MNRHGKAPPFHFPEEQHKLNNKRTLEQNLCQKDNRGFNKNKKKIWWEGVFYSLCQNAGTAQKYAEGLKNRVSMLEGTELHLLATGGDSSAEKQLTP